MDRIRKALELSRAQRAAGPGRPVAQTPERTGAAGREEAAQVVRVRTRVAAVREDELRRNRVLVPGVEDAAWNAYRMLRTQTLHLLNKHGFRSIAVVSPAAEDGRTLTAINLAVAIAADPDHTALLVDLDLRRPSVHRYFGIAPTRGVVECLRSAVDVTEVAVRPEPYSKLVLLTGADAETGSAELLSGEGVRRLTGELHDRYANRIVIYDLPPLLSSADALAFLPCVDSALLVACEGRTRRQDIAQCLDLLRGTPIAGTVLNGSRAKPAGTG